MRRSHGSFRELLRYPNFLFAIVAQFLYVGAQVGTWSYFIQYVQDGTHEPEKIAGYFLTGTLVAFGVGRFSSAALMRYVKPAYLMGIYSLVNIGLVAVGVAFPGWVGLWAIFATSFFMSVMFPTIFASGDRGAGSEHEDRRIAYCDGDRWGRRAHSAHGLDFTNAAQHRESIHGSAFLLLRNRSLLVCWGAHETKRGFGVKKPLMGAIFRTAASLLMMTGVAAFAQQPAPDWQTRLAQVMPLLGHRNWIMIVDSAYPLQSSAGVETLETNADQLEVLRKVLGAIDSSIQVRPIVYMDAELPYVTEKDAPGVTAYREGVKSVLGGRAITSLPHEQIIAKVDEVGKTFHIVVLKTTMTVPYTSVFLQLNCKYWSDDAEAAAAQSYERRDSEAISSKRSGGATRSPRLCRPTYASANVGHPPGGQKSVWLARGMFRRLAYDSRSVTSRTSLEPLFAGVIKSVFSSHGASWTV